MIALSTLLLLLLSKTSSVDGFSATMSASSATITRAPNDLQQQQGRNEGGGGGIILLSDDIQRELESQHPNENAPVYDYKEQGHIHSMIPLDEQYWNLHNHLIRHNHFERKSLDDLFPDLNFSERFNTLAKFRDDLRRAIRYDMISDESIYGPNEQRYQELDKNQPLLGYWKDTKCTTTTTTTPRMNKTTNTLRQHFGSINAPTGDEFMQAIGSLCHSTQPPFHWTEVVGVTATQNKKLGEKTEHAWHQDYGHLEMPHENNKLVFLAFPPHNHYKGTGVFPHVIKLKCQQWAKPRDVMDSSIKPTFYRGTVPNQYIVRPRYVPGEGEIILFRDVDVLHSSPDIQYRASVMRFG
jgi:hypothetical protein